MSKMMKRYLSLFLSLCMLSMAIPSISFAEEGNAPIGTTEPTVTPEPTVTAETTPGPIATPEPTVTSETTPEPIATPEPTATSETMPGPIATPETTVEPIATVETSPEPTTTADITPEVTEEPTPVAEEPTPVAETPTPVWIEALEGAPAELEAMYGLYEDELDLPETLTAVYSDGTRAELSVTWVCISDGLGGTAYDGECEDYEQACFTFEARLPEGALCAEDLTLPRIQVRLVLPDLGIALYTAADEVTITNTHGTLSYSYTAPEGVTVKEQQWLKNSTDIAGATGPTYTLTMDDMKNKNNVLYVRLTLEDGSKVTSEGYAMSANNQWSTHNDDLLFTNDYDQNTTGFPIDNNGIGINNLHVYVEPDVSVCGVTLTCQLLTNNGTITDSTLEIKGRLFNFGTIYDCEFSSSGWTQVSKAGIIHVPVTINGTVYKSKPGDSLQFLYGENTYEALTSWYEAECGTYDPEYVHFLYNDGQYTRVNGDMLLGLSDSFNVPYCTIEAPNGFVSGATVSASVQSAIYNSLDYY